MREAVGPSVGFELDQEYLAPFQYAAGVRSHTGIKYHRITGPTEHKQLYNPDWAAETARKHAHDFVLRCRAEARRARGGMPFPSVIVSPHLCGDFDGWERAVVDVFLDNLGRFVRGETLRNRVDTRAGFGIG